jgi:hypothetical protein
MASKDLTLYGVRISFIKNLWTAGKFSRAGEADDPKKKAEYSCHFLIPKLDAEGKKHPIVQQIHDAIIEVAKEGFKDKWETTYKALRAENKICLHDGDVKDYEGYEGQYFIRANSKVAVPVKDLDGKTDITEKSGRVYGGCIVVAYISIWAQDNDWGKRINCQLRGVQFMKDAPAFAAGGRPAGADEFKALEPVTTDMSIFT